MTSTFSHNRGFTLVELLVVITITMMGMALVGGLAVDSYKKYQTKAEVLELQQLLKSASDLAFVREQSVEITLSGDSLNMDWGAEQKQSWQFLHIGFSNTTFSINSLGIQSLSQITISTPTGNRSVVFGDL